MKKALVAEVNVSPEKALRQNIETGKEIGQIRSHVLSDCADRNFSQTELLMTCIPNAFKDLNVGIDSRECAPLFLAINFPCPISKQIGIQDCNALFAQNFPLQCNPDKGEVCKLWLGVQRQDCTNQLAKLKKDISICKAVWNVDVDICEADFRGKLGEYASRKLDNAMELTDRAVDTQDETVCNQIQSGLHKEACIAKVAIKKNDKVLCYSTSYTNECDKHFGVNT